MLPPADRDRTVFRFLDPAALGRGGGGRGRKGVDDDEDPAKGADDPLAPLVAMAICWIEDVVVVVVVLLTVLLVVEDRRDLVSVVVVGGSRGGRGIKL